MIFKTLVVAIVIVWTTIAASKNDPELLQKWNHCDRPVFFLADYSTMDEFIVKTRELEPIRQKQEVEFSQNLGLKINFPFYFNPEWKVGGGVRYYLKTLELDQDFVDPSRLGPSLDEKLLQRYGFRFYLLRKNWGKKAFFSRMALDINNVSPNMDNFFSNYVKVEFQAVYILNSKSRWEYGWGLGFGYQFGTPLLLPILYTSGYLSPRQRVTFFLPKNIGYEFLWNRKTKISAYVKVSGTSYSLESDNPAKYERLEIRQSEITAFATIDREITDWLWFNVNTGLLHNFKFEVVEPNLFGKDKSVLKAGAFNAPYIGLRLYAVVPSRWMK